MVADKLILMEVRKAIGEFEHKLLDKTRCYPVMPTRSLQSICKDMNL